jgi:hypothetical protein
MNPDLGALPSHLQVMAVMIIVTVSGIVATVKYIKPFLGSSKPDPSTTDTVVVGASFADGKLIKALTESIDELRESIDELVIAQRHGRMESQLNTEALSRITSAMHKDQG